MATLERRIEALEKSDTGASFELVVIRAIIDPDRPDAERLMAKFNDDTLYAHPGESEGDFAARLGDMARELRRAGKGPVRIIMRRSDVDL